HPDLPQCPQELTLSGTGHDQSNIPGPVCQASCTTQWDQGSALALTATAGRATRFVGWKGGVCAGVADCRLTIDAAASVSAAFGPVTVPVRVSIAGKGKVTCTPVCSRVFRAG